MEKTILVTGATGFLGKYLIKELSGEVETIGRHNSDLIYDLGKQVPILKKYYSSVIHAAGKAHSIPKTKEEIELFFKVNVEGTKNLLKSLEAVGPPEHFVFISSVSVYGKESGVLITEDEPLLAVDPYGKSKIYAEKIIKDWCNQHNVTYTILRLPLIMGMNPLGNLESMILGIKRGYYFNIGGGKARKSMVLADDVAKLIPFILNIGGIYNLTDGYNPTFYELSLHMANQIRQKAPQNMPLWVAIILARIGDLIGKKAPINTNKLKKITSDLTFDDSKARNVLGWSPKLVLDNFKI